jgi:two-component system, OmpR family, phosphate regulon sensor histidine kinase PhoR
MSRQGAQISWIPVTVALVFPAIIGAAIALAYYGYRYAVAASVRSKASLMDGNQQLANLLIEQLQDRIDKTDSELFEELEWTDAAASPPATVDLPAGVKSVALLDENLRIRMLYPPPDPARRKRELDRWQSYVKGLDWKSLKPWTPDQPGNFRHLHQLFEGKSVLIAYAAKKTADDRGYYVAADWDLGLIAKDWIPDEMDVVTGKRRVVILDEVARPVYGDTQPPTPFQYEASLGKTLYAWRIQITPRNVAELRAQAETERLLGVLLVPVSTVIIAVGLGVVWLSTRAERRASQMKSDFIANVSHELKTPLSLIRMFGELLATGRHKGDAMAREYGGIITRESERLAHLIDNVLDFARLERGKASYSFAEGRLEEVVERALDVFQHRIEKDKLRLRTEIEPNLPTVRMDEDAMTLVLLNLVDNAVKYGGDGGEVSVRLRRAPGAVALAIGDRGAGIAPEELRRIFERFYRASGARSRNVRGSGIGLALVKHIAEAHGGRVEVDSQPGRGSTFTVYLPVAPVMPAAPEERAVS